MNFQSVLNYVLCLLSCPTCLTCLRAFYSLLFVRALRDFFLIWLTCFPFWRTLRAFLFLHVLCALILLLALRALIFCALHTFTFVSVPELPPVTLLKNKLLHRYFSSILTSELRTGSLSRAPLSDCFHFPTKSSLIILVKKQLWKCLHFSCVLNAFCLQNFNILCLQKNYFHFVFSFIRAMLLTR